MIIAMEKVAILQIQMLAASLRAIGEYRRKQFFAMTVLETQTKDDVRLVKEQERKDINMTNLLQMNIEEWFPHLDEDALENVKSEIILFAMRNRIRDEFDAVYKFKQEKAKSLSQEYHKNLYGSRPYLLHLEEVVNILYDYGYSGYEDTDVIVLGYLHDILEDTDVAPEVIRYYFGDKVLNALKLVTDADGANRKEKKEKTYTRLKEADNYLAVTVKLADRIANYRNCKKNGLTGLQEMYDNEMEMFRTIRIEGHANHLWKALEEEVNL